MSITVKKTDYPTPDLSPDTPGQEIPTESLMDATTIGLSDEEQAQLFQEPNIGPYKIIRKIGEGGMGAVFLAERNDDQYRKQVAIKLIRRGMDTEHVVRRFKNERQILASLDHPNIARLLDGGTTADGRPYFVMEYIEGKPISRYADETSLNVIERLKLFRKVSAAVHYAHQNLIIHRDIKPSNIMVTEDGVPKLLDFGIAKLLNPEAAEEAPDATATMMRLMTPEYASPEQVKGDPVTTATDIYSLGVVLYELLTGRRPYRIASRLPHDIIRIICEEEPQRPSTAVARVETIPNPTGGEPISLTPEDVSRVREGHPEKLRRRLRGDLDNIILMAMRKEPQRRYASVDQFSGDIRRYLEGRPVIAGKDTILYRGTKFVRRNKAAVIAALLILATLVGGIITTSIQRARSERLFNDVRNLANSFMFEIHDAIKNLPGSTPARELLVTRALEYLNNIAKDMKGDPSLQRELATAYRKVGDVQGYVYDSNLGDTKGALDSYHKALAIQQKLAADDPANRDAKRDLAITYSRIGDVTWAIGDTKPALEAYQEAVAIGEQLIAADQQDIESSRDLYSTYRKMGRAEAQAGDFESAVTSFDRARVINESVIAADPNNQEMQLDMSISYSSMGEVLAETGDPKGAVEYYKKALAIDEQLWAADPNNVRLKRFVAIDSGNIGEALVRAGDLRGALDSYHKALSIGESLVAADPNDVSAQRNVAIFHMKIGLALSSLGSYGQALESFRNSTKILEAFPQTEATSTFGRAELAITYSYIGLMLAKTKDATGALEISAKGRAIAEELMNSNPANVELRGLVALSYSNLGEINASIAASESGASKKLAKLREARDWHQKSFDILSELASRKEWVSQDYGSPQQARQKIAECDAAIEKMQK